MRSNVIRSIIVAFFGSLFLSVSAFGASLHYSAIRPEDSTADLIAIQTEWADHLVANDGITLLENS